MREQCPELIRCSFIRRGGELSAMWGHREKVVAHKPGGGSPEPLSQTSSLQGCEIQVLAVAAALSVLLCSGSRRGPAPAATFSVLQTIGWGNTGASRII